PGAFGQAVVAGQRVGVGADVCCALDVIVPAEDVGAATRLADIAERELQDTGGTHHGVADGVLRLPHAPHDGAGTVLVQGGGNLEHGGLVHPTGFLDLVGSPFGEHIGLDVFHA